MSISRAGRVAVLMLVTTLTGLVLAPSARAIDTDFQYEINPQHNFGKCLDISGAGKADRTPLIQFDCTGLPNQRFRFRKIVGDVYEIRAVHSGKCLDVRSGSTANNAEVIQFTCSGVAANQRFRLLKDTDAAGFATAIMAVHSSKCLAVQDGSNANFAKVIQFTCNGTTHQRFDGLAH